MNNNVDCFNDIEQKYLHHEDMKDDEDLAPFALSLHKIESTNNVSDGILYGNNESNKESNPNERQERKDGDQAEIMPPGSPSFETSLPSSAILQQLQSASFSSESLNYNHQEAFQHFSQEDTLPSNSTHTPSSCRINSLLGHGNTFNDSIIAAAAADASMLLQTRDSSKMSLSFEESTTHSAKALDFTQLMKEADNTLTLLESVGSDNDKNDDDHSTLSGAKNEESSDDESLYYDSQAEYIPQQISFKTDASLSNNSSMNIRSVSSTSTPMASNITMIDITKNDDKYTNRNTLARSHMGLELESASISISNNDNNKRSISYPTGYRNVASSPHFSVRTSRSGDDSFRAQILIPKVSVKTVINIASNIDMLRLWCDPVVATFITKESERTGIDREYDGEWLEAASTLQPPVGGGFGIYNSYRTLKTYLGFPNHGHITIFIERERGQIGLTLGPLGGDCEVLHTMRFEQCGPDVKVIDSVKINREYVFDRMNSRSIFATNHSGDENPCHSFLNCCSSSFGMMSCCCPASVQRWFLPNLENHVQQTIKSMKNLRNLVEHGESAVMDATCGGGARSDVMDDKGMVPLLEGHIPLIGGHFMN